MHHHRRAKNHSPGRRAIGNPAYQSSLERARVCADGCWYRRLPAVEERLRRAIRAESYAAAVPIAEEAEKRYRKNKGE